MSKNPDLSEFIRYSKPKRKPCPVAQVKEALHPGDAAKLDAAMLTEKDIITVGAIYQWLDARGHKLTHAAIGSHRRHQCRCYDA